MITQQIDAEADVRVQTSSLRPGINEICRYVRHCPSSHSNFFVLENIVTLHLKKYVTLTYGGFIVFK